MTVVQYENRALGRKEGCKALRLSLLLNKIKTPSTHFQGKFKHNTYGREEHCYHQRSKL